MSAIGSNKDSIPEIKFGSLSTGYRIVKDPKGDHNFDNRPFVVSVYPKTPGASNPNAQGRASRSHAMALKAAEDPWSLRV